jgi:hypothetical protein
VPVHCEAPPNLATKVKTLPERPVEYTNPLSFTETEILIESPEGMRSFARMSTDFGIPGVRLIVSFRRKIPWE